MSDIARDLLPYNATAFERALSLSTDTLPRIGAQISALRGIKYHNTPDSFLPFLIYEYGLGALTPFFNDPRELIEEGLAWERQRGTHGALNQALGWIGLGTDLIEPFPTRRRRWNLFMLAMNALPVVEQYEKIEDLARLSVPLRSKFWRGYRTYDVRAIDYSHSKWAQNRWSSYSGVRVREGGAKWSFGREYSQNHAMTEAELTSLGVWIAPGGSSLTWGAFSWADAGAAWADASETTRRRTMINALVARPVWIEFRNGTTVIGRRRAKVKRGVSVDARGVYSHAGIKYAIDTVNPSAIYLEFLTDFEDGFGSTCDNWRLLWDASPLDIETPGLQWATAAQTTTGTPVYPVSQTIEFRRTVRERFRVLLTF